MPCAFSPRPLRELEAATLAGVRVVLTDIDDTLTCEGRLPSVAFDAIERLDRVGVAVIPVTGRPAGWCDLIARQWPVAGVVGENGALFYRHEHAAHRMHRRFAVSGAARERERARLDELAAEVLRQVPDARLAADQPFRLFDVAIDVAEDVHPPLSQADVQRILDIFIDAGASARLSSIHVNAWFGDYDKLGMTREVLLDLFAIDLHTDVGSVAYLGDSPNDASLFGAVGLSVGVANIAPFLDRIVCAPAYVCEAAGGLGFAEFANRLLSHRTP